MKLPVDDVPRHPGWDINGNLLGFCFRGMAHSSWLALEELDNVLQDIVEAASELVGQPIVKIARKGPMVAEVVLEDERHLFLRRPHFEGDDAWVDIFNSDIDITEWIRSQGLRTPVPAVCYTGSVWSDGIERFFSLVEALPGSCVTDGWHLVKSLAHKEQIICSYADFLIELASLDVPQTYIGTTRWFDDPEFEVIPLLRFTPFHRAEEIFWTIEEYLVAIIEQFRNEEHIGGRYNHKSRNVLRKLEGKILRYCRNIAYSSPSRRLMFSHDDLRPLNILISSTELTGVIDWEHHSMYPMALAVDYPQWIRNTGYYDPRFCQPREYWLDTPEICEHLRNVFDKYLQHKAPKMWIAFDQGRVLRETVSWIVGDPYNDEGCERLEAWMNATEF